MRPLIRTVTASLLVMSVMVEGCSPDSMSPGSSSTPTISLSRLGLTKSRYHNDRGQLPADRSRLRRSERHP